MQCAGARTVLSKGYWYYKGEEIKLIGKLHFSPHVNLFSVIDSSSMWPPRMIGPLVWWCESKLMLTHAHEELKIKPGRKSGAHFRWWGCLLPCVWSQRLIRLTGSIFSRRDAAFRGWFNCLPHQHIWSISNQVISKFSMGNTSQLATVYLDFRHNKIQTVQYLVFPSIPWSLF